MSCESQHGDGPVLQAVYLSILTILPGDYVWCFETWNIISEPKIKSEWYEASLLHEPFNLLFGVESLFFIKELKSSAWGMVVFSYNSSFSETKKWQYLQAQQVPILLLSHDSWNKKMEKSENYFDCGPKTSMNVITVIICAQCARLAGSTMWTSDSSHTCPSPQTNAMLMMAQTVVRLGAMATARCLKDILLWCGGVCEGRPSEQTWLHEKVTFHFRAQCTWQTSGSMQQHTLVTAHWNRLRSDARCLSGQETLAGRLSDRL